MNAVSIFVISDRESLLTTYSLILKEYGNVQQFYLHHSSELSSIELHYYHIVIIDINNSENLYNLSKIKHAKEKNNQNIILITPFASMQMKGYIDSIQLATYVLAKPIDINRLRQILENEAGKIKRKILLEQKNDVLTELIDLHPSRIAVFDEFGKMFYGNYKYLHANNLEAFNMDSIMFDDISECNNTFKMILKKLELASTFSAQRESEGRWFESVFYKIPGSYIIHICTDISVAKQKELQLEQSAVVFENSTEGIIITDANGIIVSVNKAFSTITGYAKDEIIGKTPSVLNSGMHDKIFYQTMWDNLKYNGSWKGEIWNKRKNGEIYPEWLSISKVVNPTYHEEFYIAIFSDVSTLKEADKKLHFYANHDVLTGLPNRLQFEMQLSSAIESSKRKNTKFGVVFIDLDKFKEVNDTYGHNVGDTMLITVSKRLASSIRKDDVLARLGGDEFVVISQDIHDASDMAIIATKLRSVLNDPITIEDKMFYMTLSIGVAIYPEHGLSSEEIIKNADVAMYEVKESGRNGYKIYSYDMTAKVATKVNMQNEMRRAIKNDEFIMYYQPVVEIKTNSIIGVEALVRWNKNDRIYTPAEFLRFVSEGDLGKNFGYLIIVKVLSDIKVINLQVKNPLFKVAINIAPDLFFDIEFVDKIKNYCKDFGVSPFQIELEMLETQIMNNPQIAQEKFNILSEMGFSIALDDFGTGYSSLNYLKNFKVSKLKIDQSFIKDMTTNTKDIGIIKAIIAISKVLNMSVQAEGVETKEHLGLLKQFECNYSQGFFHARPMSLSAFVDFYTDYQC